MHRKLIPSAF
jgi:hypothetical protein